jgi:hypothetical protein
MAPSGVGHEIGVWVVFGSVFSLSIEGSISEVGGKTLQFPVCSQPRCKKKPGRHRQDRLSSPGPTAPPSSGTGLEPGGVGVPGLECLPSSYRGQLRQGWPAQALDWMRRKGPTKRGWPSLPANNYWLPLAASHV